MEINPTNKFSDHSISLRRMVPLKREEATALNLLLYIMNGKTEKFDNRQLFSQALNHAYAFRAYSNVSGFGDQVLLDIRFSWISSDLVNEEGYMKEVVDLMDQILFHPCINEKNLAEAKYLLKNRLQIQEQDPDTQAVRLVLGSMPKDHPISIPVQGTIDQIDSITLDQIRKLADDLSKTPFEIIGVGSIEPEVMDYLENLDQTTYTYDHSKLIDLDKPAVTSAVRDIAQSSLALLYSTSMKADSREYFSLMVMNAILGSAPMNLLFEEIREKHSFCYSISSTLIRFDGALLVVTGAQKEHFDEIRDLVNEQIDKLKHAKTMISDERLKSAKLDLIDSIRMQQDSAVRMIAQAFMNSYLSRQMSAEQMYAAIDSVTLEDIEKAAAPIKLIGDACVLQSEEKQSLAQAEEDFNADLQEAMEMGDTE